MFGMELTTLLLRMQLTSGVDVFIYIIMFKHIIMFKQNGLTTIHIE